VIGHHKGWAADGSRHQGGTSLNARSLLDQGGPFVCCTAMGDGSPDAGAWCQGRNPQRQKIGVLGWALLALLLIALLTLAPS
jgi:hypothetical protein